MSIRSELGTPSSGAIGTYAERYDSNNEVKWENKMIFDGGSCWFDKLVPKSLLYFPYLAADSRLRDLLLQKDNRKCADCGAPDPKWASANTGVFICLKCSDVHRNLGTHISQVLSVSLDEWSDEDIEAMIEVGGNASANSIYEAFIAEGYSKPGPDSNHEARTKFIRAKYEYQEFLKPSLRIGSMSSQKLSEAKASFSQKFMNSFRANSSKTLNSVATAESIGRLKVRVLKGTNLAVRDVRSSDPYVVLTLGQQTVQTTVIKSNLNPVWNEELVISVPQQFGSLKVQVFDHDLLSANDLMGEAEVDLQPLITSATAFKNPEMFGNMQIGKWLKSGDNALIEDSTINIVDGEVKQHMSLKLQNVESGEIDLELQLIALDS